MDLVVAAITVAIVATGDTTTITLVTFSVTIASVSRPLLAITIDAGVAVTVGRAVAIKASATKSGPLVGL